MQTGTGIVRSIRWQRTFAYLPMLALVAMAGCEGPSDGPDQSDGLTGVPERSLREVFRLGGLEPPPEQAFQRAPPLAVDRRGWTYALHADRGQVAAFGADGEFRRWIGAGRGEGPGEFTFPLALGFVGDSLWIRNLSMPRISRFLRDGSHLSTERVLADADYRTTAGAQGVSGYLQGDRAWMAPYGFVVSDDPDAAAPFILGDRAMERQDTLFSWRAGRGRLAGTSFRPLAEPPFHAVAPDGSVILVAEWNEEEPERLTIRLFEPTGELRDSWELPAATVPVPGGVRDSLVTAAREHVAEVRERVIEQGIPQVQAPSVPDPDEVRQQVFLPEHYPPIGAVRLGIDGTVWVQRTDGLDDGPWLALEPDGTPLFQVRLPEEAKFRHGSSEAIWGTEIGEMDVPYVVRWEIAPAGR